MKKIIHGSVIILGMSFGLNSFALLDLSTTEDRPATERAEPATGAATKVRETVPGLNITAASTKSSEINNLVGGDKTAYNALLPGYQNGDEATSRLVDAMKDDNNLRAKAIAQLRQGQPVSQVADALAPVGSCLTGPNAGNDIAEGTTFSNEASAVIDAISKGAIDNGVCREQLAKQDPEVKAIVWTTVKCALAKGAGGLVGSARLEKYAECLQQAKQGMSLEAARTAINTVQTKCRWFGKWAVAAVKAGQ